MLAARVTACPSRATGCPTIQVNRGSASAIRERSSSIQLSYGMWPPVVADQEVARTSVASCSDTPPSAGEKTGPADYRKLNQALVARLRCPRVKWLLQSSTV